MKRRILITEEEKENILSLYEQSEQIPQPSKFVRDMSSILGVTTDLMIALDWSLYKDGGQSPNPKTVTELSKIFSSLKPVLNNSVKKINSNPNNQKRVSQYLNSYKTGTLTREQIMFLNDLKKQIQVTTKTEEPKPETPTSSYEMGKGLRDKLQTGGML